jgi:hypothetical protein
MQWTEDGAYAVEFDPGEPITVVGPCGGIAVVGGPPAGRAGERGVET